MRIKFPAFSLVAMAATLSTGFGQNQSVLDLLRALRPGQTAPQQAAPAAPSQSAPAAPATTPIAATPAPALDTKPAFISVITNVTKITNQIIVTNYVVVTNLSYTTNLYNAQGQLLTPVTPGLLPALAANPATPKPSSGPDPAVVRAGQLQAVRDLLVSAIGTSSNLLCAEGSFSQHPDKQIRIPEGMTILDRKKSQTLSSAMNSAAEKAAPGAFAILAKTAQQLNPPEPAQILQGGSDAATRFLLSAEGQNLVNQVLPAVQSAAATARVPEAYNAAMLKGGGLLGAVLGTSESSVDINAHITRGLMEAIVLQLSSQETVIRTDATARKTKALQNAFPTKPAAPH